VHNNETIIIKQLNKHFEKGRNITRNLLWFC